MLRLLQLSTAMTADAKYLRYSLLCMSLGFLSACTTPKSGSQTGVVEGDLSLVVTVSEIDCSAGVLRLALYHDRAFWMKDHGMARGRISMITGAEQTIELHGLPPGNYAIAIHHDINNDGKFNRRFGFLPQEPYGFSNDVGKYGPASFDAASLELDGDEQIAIVLNPPVIKNKRCDLKEDDV